MFSQWFGVVHVHEDSDDDDAFTGEQKEIAKEMEELRVAQYWINQAGWDASVEGRAVASSSGEEVDLRLDWGEVQRTLAKGAQPKQRSAQLDAATVFRDYSLDKLDPTQRAFADRVLDWVKAVGDRYRIVKETGHASTLPCLRTWLGGSAGSGNLLP